MLLSQRDRRVHFIKAKMEKQVTDLQMQLQRPQPLEHSTAESFRHLISCKESIPFQIPSKATGQMRIITCDLEKSVCVAQGHRKGLHRWLKFRIPYLYSKVFYVYAEALIQSYSRYWGHRTRFHKRHL